MLVFVLHFSFSKVNLIKLDISIRKILGHSGSPYTKGLTRGGEGGGGVSSFLFPGSLILEDTLLIPTLSLLLSLEPFEKFLGWCKIHSLYGEVPKLIYGVLM